MIPTSGRAFKEPLFHFILIGISLFVANGIWEKFAACPDCEIHVSSAELTRQARLFAGENRRQPSDGDLLALLYAHIEEEALMREARKLGLEDGDVIIRRRLAQKMRFIAEKSPPPALPSEKSLKAWFEDHQDAFGTAEKRSFFHIYFSPQRRGDGVEAIAAHARSKITPENWKTQGDPFVLENTFSMQSYDQVTQTFGEAFAAALFALDTNALDTKTADTHQPWHGPVRSAFGIHLVQLHAIKEATLPDFKTARAQVEDHWIKTHQTIEAQKSIRSIIDKYRILLDGEPVKQGE